MFSFFSKINPYSRLKKLEQDNQKLRTMYAAAKTNRLTGAWSPGGIDNNAIIAASSPLVRARVRQSVRDFPYLAGALKRLADYEVGTGIKFQSRIQNNKRQLNKNLIQKTEDQFNFWAEKSDPSGNLHFYEQMRLAARQLPEAGEYFLIKHYPKNLKIPFQLQMIEGDQLASSYYESKNKNNEIIDGVEREKLTGRPVIYHFQDDYGKPMPIPANRVIHGFETLRPGQVRGISSFVSGVLLAHNIEDYLDAELDRARKASKWLAMITKLDTSSGYGFGGADIETNPEGRKIEYLENAILEYLRPGEDIKLSSNPGTGPDFDSYLSFLLRMLSISTGLPYSILANDYRGYNYTVLRAERNDFKHSLNVRQMHHIRHFCMPIFKDFMDVAVLSGALPFKNYFSDPMMYLRSEWQPPGLPPVDQLKETKADVDAVTNKLKSRSELAKGRGRDLESIFEEIQYDDILASDYNIDLNTEKTSTAIASNPAKITEEQGKDNDESTI